MWVGGRDRQGQWAAAVLGGLWLWWPLSHPSAEKDSERNRASTQPWWWASRVPLKARPFSISSALMVSPITGLVGARLSSVLRDNVRGRLLGIAKGGVCLVTGNGGLVGNRARGPGRVGGSGGKGAGFDCVRRLGDAGVDRNKQQMGGWRQCSEGIQA